MFNFVLLKRNEGIKETVFGAHTYV